MACKCLGIFGYRGLDAKKTTDVQAAATVVIGVGWHQIPAILYYGGLDMLKTQAQVQDTRSLLVAHLDDSKQQG